MSRYAWLILSLNINLFLSKKIDICQFSAYVPFVSWSQGRNSSRKIWFPCFLRNILRKCFYDHSKGLLISYTYLFNLWSRSVYSFLLSEGFKILLSFFLVFWFVSVNWDPSFSCIKLVLIVGGWEEMRTLSVSHIRTTSSWEVAEPFCFVNITGLLFVLISTGGGKSKF